MNKIPKKKMRSLAQKIKDFLTLPLRALTPFEDDKWGLSSTRSERFEYAGREVRGYCLDVGCGKNNIFINKFLGGYGRGIDVFPYEGLTEENLVSDIHHFPFGDASFDSVTFIANLNHIPPDSRVKELGEAYRCLKSGGNIIITMPCAFAGILIHKIVHAHDHLFGTNYDVDSTRGMHHEEAFYLPDSVIVASLSKAGFKDIKKKYFFTQWGMNHLFVGWKK